MKLLCKINILPLICFLILFFSDSVFANGKVTETSANMFILLIVAAIGGIVTILGAMMIFRGIGGKADVNISVSEHKKITFKKVGQGVVVIIIGALILISALYFGQQKRDIEGKKIDLKEETVNH